MTDIVERLRACENDLMWADHAEIPKRWCKEAADEIERLRKLYSDAAYRAGYDYGYDWGRRDALEEAETLVAERYGVTSGAGLCDEIRALKEQP